MCGCDDGSVCGSTRKPYAEMPTDVKSQGQDGTAHLTYYDKENQLSFVWDGTQGTRVAISVGGYAEAVDPNLVLHFNETVRYTGQRLLDEFRALCRDFVETYTTFTQKELMQAAADTGWIYSLEQVLLQARLNRG